MGSKATLQDADRLVKQLSVWQQEELAARIRNRLKKCRSAREGGQRRQRSYAAQIAAFLEMSERMPAEPTGEVDSAQDIRRIREERASLL
jgi:hypothetical protein